MNNLLQRITTLLLATFLMACGVPAATPSVQPDSDTIAISEQQVQDLARHNGDFAVELYRQAAAENDDNLVFSPYSISLAFSMLYAGAQNNTEAQLAKAFHYLPQNVQHGAFRGLAQHIAKTPEQAKTGENAGVPFQLNIANATWGQQTFPFKKPFLQVLAQEYNAELKQVDFTQRPVETAAAINDWIANETQNRIRDLVRPDVINAKTRLVLVNAVYFKGSWLLPFYEGETKTGTFTLRDNTSVQVPIMFKQQARIPCLEGADYQAIELPYVGEKVDMVLILPNEGHFEQVEAALSSELLNQIRSKAELHDVSLRMPRFKFETNLALPALLQQRGVTDAFGAAADFEGMSEGGLFLSDALHRSVIAVDEQGTEAAAATVAPMALSSFKQAVMNLNHPFLFAIMERDTGTILFLGRVMNPAKF